MSLFQRREARFSLNEGQHIAAGISFEDGNAEGTVVNISQRGAKLAVGQSLPDDTEVSIRLTCASMKWTIELPGKVHWKHPDRNEGWYVGCSFRTAMPTAALERLATAGVINRRQEKRHAVNKDVLVKLELSDFQHAARLVDVSPGGFKLWLPCSVTEGERIVVIFADEQDEVRTVGKVLWHVSTGDGFFIGCAFVRREGYAHMTQHLTLLDSPEAPGPQRHLSLAHGMSLAAAVAAAAYGLFTHFWM